MKYLKEGDPTQAYRFAATTKDYLECFEADIRGSWCNKPKGNSSSDIKTAVCIMPPNISLDNAASQKY